MHAPPPLAVPALVARTRNNKEKCCSPALGRPRGAERCFQSPPNAAMPCSRWENREGTVCAVARRSNKTKSKTARKTESSMRSTQVYQLASCMSRRKKAGEVWAGEGGGPRGWCGGRRLAGERRGESWGWLGVPWCYRRLTRLPRGASRPVRRRASRGP